MGSTGKSFKERYKNHKYAFNSTNKRHKTELVNCILDLKHKSTDFKIKWEILSTT